MDLIRKQPVLLTSLLSIAVLTILSGMAIAKLSAFNYAQAQEDPTDPALAAGSSFACEPLVFTLSATDEASASGSPIAQASGTPRASASATPRASSTASPSPSGSGAAKGGVSPTPSATAKASSTASVTATATIKPTSTSTATKGGLPEAGVSAPTIVGIIAGLFLLLAAALFAM